MRPENARDLARANQRPFSFTKDGVTIDVHDVRFGNPFLVVEVSAHDANGDLPVSNPYMFANPPVLVPDGSFFRRDEREALKQIVYDAVVGWARSNGWPS